MAILIQNGLLTSATSTQWMCRRSKNDVVGGVYGDRWWWENLRMSRETFMVLCDKLRPHLERQTTWFREPVSVEAREWQ